MTLTCARPPWAAVLAGGQGTRMRPLITRWLGHDRPKQYCAFVGGRSMLGHTLDRASALAPHDRLLTVIAAGHRQYLSSTGSGSIPGTVLEQPADRGTAAGILLPAVYAMEGDPAATLLILPSDHFIRPRERLVEHLRFASLLAQQHPSSLVLLGAAPDSPEPDFGWIVPGTVTRASLSHHFVPDPHQVLCFYEKPRPAEANELYHRGGLWNTMMVAVRTDTLWQLAHELLPEMMRGFDTLRHRLRAVRAGRLPATAMADAVAAVYGALEPADFSRDLVQRAPQRALVLPMRGIEWSDWGRPERVLETLTRLGKQPAFPLDAMG